jgi:hypothetical protein
MVLTLLLGALSAVYADSATWNVNPTSGDWNTADNWDPPTVPNGPHDVATFDLSSENALVVSQNTIVASVEFTPDAAAFSITVNPPYRFTVDGTGLTNSSGLTQHFVTQVDEEKRRGMIEFSGSSTVTGAVSITNHGSLSGLCSTPSAVRPGSPTHPAPVMGSSTIGANRANLVGADGPPFTVSPMQGTASSTATATVLRTSPSDMDMSISSITRVLPMPILKIEDGRVR